MAKMQFIKNENYYWINLNDKIVGRIDIHYNFFDRSNYYTVDGKTFTKLNDAKKYVRENF